MARSYSVTIMAVQGRGVISACICICNTLIHDTSHTVYVPFCSVGQGHGEGSRGVHRFEKIARSLLSFLRNRRMSCAYVYIVHVVLTCANCLTWTTDAPKGLMDSFVAYFEAVKKEYDVCYSPVQLACV